MASDELKNLLNPCNDGELADIVRRAREMGELTHILSKGLPGEYAGAIVAANLREDGDLVIIAASSAWASSSPQRGPRGMPASARSVERTKGAG